MAKSIIIKSGNQILATIKSSILENGIYWATIQSVDLKENDSEDNPYTIIIGYKIYDEDGSSIVKDEYYQIGGKYSYKFEALYDSFKNKYQVTDTFNIDDLLDLDVYVTVTKNGIYNNITYVDFDVQEEQEVEE